MQKQAFFEKIFSTKRMQRYFDAHKDDPVAAILHYQCNIELAEAFYPSIAVFEVALRNALNRELIALAGRNDWYVSLFAQPGLSELRRAFPYMPKAERKRKNVSAPLNSFRAFRNRVFHHEPICWNLTVVREIHREMITVMGWINKDLPEWIAAFDRFEAVAESIEKRILKK